MAMGGGAALTADLAARAIIAAALSYGDDPLRIGRNQFAKRSLTAAAAAVADALAMTDRSAARILGLGNSALCSARRVATPGFARAAAAAEEALRYALKSRPAPADLPPAPATPAGHTAGRAEAARAPAASAPSSVAPSDAPFPIRRGLAVGTTGRMAAADLPEAAPIPALSPRRASLKAFPPAKPKPREEGFQGTDPAESAAMRYEARFVREKRALEPPMPWAHVARQLGKSEDYVRRSYDMDFHEPAPPRPAPPCAPLPPARVKSEASVRPVSRTIRAGTMEALALGAIAAGHDTRDRLVRHLDRSKAAVYALAYTLQNKELVELGAEPWRLTPAGERELRRVAAEADA